MTDPASKNMKKQLRKTICHEPLATSEYTEIKHTKPQHNNITLARHGDIPLISTPVAMRQKDCFDFKTSLTT